MATASLTHLSKKMQARKELDVRVGDTVKVHVKIEEKGKTRTQVFQGLVLARKHGAEAGGTITVRKVSNGVGVERIFPIYSPMLEKIEVVRRSRVRRAKLYYIRTKVAREIRRKMRNFIDYFATTDDLVIPAEEMEEEVIEETPTEGQEEVSVETGEATDKVNVEDKEGESDQEAPASEEKSEESTKEDTSETPEAETKEESGETETQE